MESYTVNPIFSDQHGKIDLMFPKNSFRTFIAGNSRLSKMHTRMTTDSKEKQLKDDFKILEGIMNDYHDILKEKCKLLYFKISGIYTKHKTKKTKTKVFTFCIYSILKEEGIVISHKKLSAILNLDVKKICSGIKDVDNFLNTVNYNIDIKSCPININSFVHELELPFKINSWIEQIYEILVEKEEFKSHKPMSLLGAILFFVCEKYNLNTDKKKICEKIDISETTIYQINKKIKNFYNQEFNSCSNEYISIKPVST